ncbi:sigma-E factor negative regulatory protein [Chitinimonas sp.]|uniref:sigma-E factor negative regulatory protein n=1 Tax=Chitinimonas sp. TaxID=1934313 RepID=UPI0035B0DA3E
MNRQFVGAKTMQEKFSAMIDGELDEREFAELMAEFDADDECAEQFGQYQLISDALSGQAMMSDDFMSRFSARLEQEPVVLAPHAMRRPRTLDRRWVALSMAASVALVSATAWYVGHGQIYAAPAEATVAANQVMSEADASPYLLAHQAMVGNPGFYHKPVILTGAEAERHTAGR